VSNKLHCKSGAVQEFYMCDLATSRPGSSISIVAGYGLGDRCLIPDRGGGFFLYPLHLAGSVAHPVSSTVGTGDLPRGKCSCGMLLTTHPLLVPWVRKERGSTSSPPACQNWHIMGNFYLYLFLIWQEERQLHLI
jgi:hypothetical protein